ncbi:transcription factor Zn, C2H2 [Purpureocillium lavendulum]|uniref:Transcription factor Zn, C2H2 n=1 Tax=Purpureocillium lavendulum TaxID=1247861 RepID=A0AB34FMQ0_9HYPO|nr:transcription factor Zn, C2H2 [Purpureocillium lavendulum]
MSTPNSASAGAPRDIRSFFTSRSPSQQQQQQQRRQQQQQHYQRARSRTPMKRSSTGGSSEEEDPLSSRPPPRSVAQPTPAPVLKPPQPAPAATRIAVMLPGSPAKAPPPVVSDLVPRPAGSLAVKKETPIPLPRIPNWPAAAASAPVTAASTPVVASAVKSGRGRPKGWKPGMSYSVMRGKAAPGASGRPRHVKVRVTGAALPPQGMAKRRGRPPKPPSPPPEAVYRSLKPQFADFLCEWAGCKAELHNLETLRRHLFAVHGRSEVCMWAKCAQREPRQTLVSGDQFRQHVEEAHLVPFAWHMGDGPQNRVGGSLGPAGAGTGTGPADEKDADAQVLLPTYLLDADGNQVTPSVREQEVEDLATWRSNRRKLKELLIQRNEALPDEESSDEPEDEHG